MSERDFTQELLAQELRELLGAFIDAMAIDGHVVTPQQWERACLLAGRYCAPFIAIGEEEAGHE